MIFAPTEFTSDRLSDASRRLNQIRLCVTPAVCTVLLITFTLYAVVMVFLWKKLRNFLIYIVCVEEAIKLQFWWSFVDSSINISK